MKYYCILFLALASAIKINNGTSEATPVDHEKVLDDLLGRPDVYSSVDHYKMRGDWAKPNATLGQKDDKSPVKSTNPSFAKKEAQSKNVVIMTPAGYAAAYPEDAKSESKAESLKKQQSASREAK